MWVCLALLQIKFRDVGLMVVDTSQHGWTVLHADCNHPGIDGRQAEGHSLWDKLKIPDVVSLLPPSCCILAPQGFGYLSASFVGRSQGCSELLRL